MAETNKAPRVPRFGFARRKAASPDAMYSASQWQLMWRKLRKHKLARVSLIILGVLYLQALLGQFIAPQGLTSYSSKYKDCPPTAIHWFTQDGAFRGPFVYGVESQRDPETLRRIFAEDTSAVYPLRFFVKADAYRFLGLFETDRHLFGVDAPGAVFLFGTDSMGRDIFSRIVLGSRVSLTIPLAGIALSFLLGLLIGSVSGYFGGLIDTLIQRLIEIIRSFPTLPLWMALSAAIPARVPVVQMYLMITIILSMISWTGLARVVRSKFISLREEDYVMAARIGGVGDRKIITSHLIPGFMSYLIVDMTLGIPGMIIGETSMSFLGLGIRSPATSWGVLLQEAQEIQNVALSDRKSVV